MKTLIVEDNKSSSEILKKLLAPFGAVSIATNGEEAFDLYCNARSEGAPFELMLLDILMPLVDGHTCLAAIREYEEHLGIVGSDAIPVIVISSINESGDLYQATAQGCSAYLVKPIDKEKLFFEIKRLGLVPQKGSDDTPRDGQQQT